MMAVRIGGKDSLRVALPLEQVLVLLAARVEALGEDLLDDVLARLGGVARPLRAARDALLGRHALLSVAHRLAQLLTTTHPLNTPRSTSYIAL